MNAKLLIGRAGLIGLTLDRELVSRVADLQIRTEDFRVYEAGSPRRAPAKRSASRSIRR